VQHGRTVTISDRRSAFVPAAMRRFPLRVVINSGWTGGSGLRCDGDSSDLRPRKGFSNRYNATMPAAQALLSGLATATRGPCSALKKCG
jgi:hypothetical protein